MTFIYFVSYAHERGFGNIQISQPFEMTEANHVRGCEKVIRDSGKCDQPTVISYQLLRTVTS